MSRQKLTPFVKPYCAGSCKTGDFLLSNQSNILYKYNDVRGINPNWVQHRVLFKATSYAKHRMQTCTNLQADLRDVYAWHI